MRKKYKEQLPLMEQTTDHPHAVEMELIDKILEKTSTICELALQDLTKEVKNQETGANGMSAEQVVKSAIVKQSKGNPADVTLVETMLENQKMIYDKYPSKVSLDGGFASKDNLKLVKGKMIKDVCFARKRGLNEEDMCKSSWVYKNLRNFRAGIESGILWLKRCFGLARCTWKTFESFKSYVWASIVSANLMTLARKQMA
jgi:Transposase DDE domain.